MTHIIFFLFILILSFKVLRENKKKKETVKEEKPDSFWCGLQNVIALSLERGDSACRT